MEVERKCQGHHYEGILGRKRKGLASLKGLEFSPGRFMNMIRKEWIDILLIYQVIITLHLVIFLYLETVIHLAIHLCLSVLRILLLFYAFNLRYRKVMEPQ